MQLALRDGPDIGKMWIAWRRDCGTGVGRWGDSPASFDLQRHPGFDPVVLLVYDVKHEHLKELGHGLPEQ
jgi:hypothetical protein